jgi:hypothetical protein
LLEAEHGIRDTDSKIGRGLGMPVDLGDSTFNGIRILKDHHCLGGNALARQLRLLTAEILFEEIDLIVLFNCFLSTNNEILGGLGETKRGISVKLLLILSYISRLSVIELLRPTY